MNGVDVLILGTGIAGLTSAIKLAEKDLNITLVTRTQDPNETNTNWAQGGIIYSDDKDLSADINKASSNTSNEMASNVLAKESKKILEEILFNKAKTEFDKDESDNLLFTKEAAHSINRIIYKGDYTGKSVQVSLLNYLKKFKNVSIFYSFCLFSYSSSSWGQY